MTKLKLFITSLILCSASFAQVSKETLIATIKKQPQAKELTPEDYSNFSILNQYQDRSTGIQHVYFRQLVGGVEIYNANSDMHYDRNGNLIVFHNKFEADAKSRTNTSTPAISAYDAMQKYAAFLGKSVSASLAKTSPTGAIFTFSDPTISKEPINVTKYYLAVGNELRLVWNVELFDNETGDWWNARIDALTGEMIERDNWTVSCHPQASNELRYSVETPIVAVQDESKPILTKTGEGTYMIVPMPLESFGHGPRQLVNSTATSNGSPFGWHDTDGVAGADWQITRGNNVYASCDTANKNIPGYSPNGGSDLTFNYDYSPRNQSSQNIPAVTTNLFYWNNLNHDIFYNYGFDEASGNYQANNYSKGGLEHDAVFADAQDGSGTNNANFSAPIDGKAGRMQMYLWTRTNAGKNNFKVLNGNYTGTYNAPPSLFGPKILSDTVAQLVLALDGSTGYTGCNTITNDLTGKIALLYRGTGSCPITQKVINAQNAGALAVVVVTGSFPSSLSGTDIGIDVPSVALARTTGDNLKNSLLNGDTIMVKLIGDTNANVMYDSDMDNGVITHEYGHGISIRLTGGPANSSCLSSAEQGGEGWSDFFALCLTAKASDTALDGRGIGTWVYDQPITGLGIRTYKYSKNKSINPHTYNSIKNLNEVHYIGEVWCAMLYDAYLDMVAKYGFNPNFYENTVGGNNMMMQLVVDAMKLQPCNPGFVDMRNAILLADSLRNGNANKSLLWKAFARRGLGLSAKQGASTSNTDGTEAYDLPVFASVSNEKAWNNVSVFPNPAVGYVQIALPDQITNAQVEIIDLAGKTIFNQNCNVSENGAIMLNTSQIEKGCYLISVSNGSQHYTTKLIID